MKPPRRVVMRPGPPAGSQRASALHRDAGTSVMPSRPSLSSVQNSSGLVTLPGKRHAMPMIATGGEVRLVCSLLTAEGEAFRRGAAVVGGDDGGAIRPLTICSGVG